MATSWLRAAERLNEVASASSPEVLRAGEGRRVDVLPWRSARHYKLATTKCSTRWWSQPRRRSTPSSLFTSSRVA